MATTAADYDRQYMERALELARRGEGAVEPNPMVGCVLVRDGTVVSEGWHRRFGGPHAEVEALAAAGDGARGATAYVTLEPCAHAGKTPPCTRALVAAGVARVVVGTRDPHALVDGRGLNELRQAGISVELGVLADEAAELIAPFRMLASEGRPWVIAKWAMTLDGKLSTRTGSSRWISGEASRARVHELRGRVDAIVVGRGTVEADDPLLTARPAGQRVAARVVLDSTASLSLEAQLVRTVGKAPVVVAAAAEASDRQLSQLRDRGVEVWQSTAPDPSGRIGELLKELGRRQFTNVLFEGGGEVLGVLHDAGLIDEVHAFVAPKLVGGAAPAPVSGQGLVDMALATSLYNVSIERLDDDVYIHGRVRR
jgi:diaminohydroxyphosphoribosylaminopyrimidine deaminase/5-amino-6-(5-phosphoribosylamino)uracil reductase